MAILGAHMSVAGGFDKAVERAKSEGCQCIQVFTTAPRQWPQTAKQRKGRAAQQAAAEEATRFQQALDDFEIGHPLVHSSYLINLASPDPVLWKNSVDAFVLELRRASQLGIPYVVLHPGAHMGSGEKAGLRRVCRALNEVHRRTHSVGSRCLLETTAGQGSSLGCRFEHLQAILEGVREPERLGVCLDTCHVFAAGYPLGTPAEYRSTMRDLGRRVGIKTVKAFHLNDSQRERGSRVDRHAHIGKGHLGLQPFRNLLNDPRFRSVPMYLETPKGQLKMGGWDKINLCALRSLIDD